MKVVDNDEKTIHDDMSKLTMSEIFAGEELATANARGWHSAQESALSR